VGRAEKGGCLAVRLELWDCRWTDNGGAPGQVWKMFSA
jgi:hypothetical protein